MALSEETFLAASRSSAMGRRAIVSRMQRDTISGLLHESSDDSDWRSEYDVRFSRGAATSHVRLAPRASGPSPRAMIPASVDETLHAVDVGARAKFDAAMARLTPTVARPVAVAVGPEDTAAVLSSIATPAMTTALVDTDACAAEGASTPSLASPAVAVRRVSASSSAAAAAATPAVIAGATSQGRGERLGAILPFSVLGPAPAPSVRPASAFPASRAAKENLGRFGFVRDDADVRGPSRLGVVREKWASGSNSSLGAGMSPFAVVYENPAAEPDVAALRRVVKAEAASASSSASASASVAATIAAATGIVPEAGARASDVRPSTAGGRSLGATSRASASASASASSSSSSNPVFRFRRYPPDGSLKARARSAYQDAFAAPAVQAARAARRAALR